MDEGTYDVTRPPILVTSEGMRVLRPEEVDTETQTIRLIPNARFLEGSSAAKAPQPPVPTQRGYGSGASSSASSRPSQAAARGQAARTASKAAGSFMQGVSKSGSVATGRPMAPPTMERRQQAAADRPWNRPGKAPPTMLMRPTGGMMDDQVEFQDSVFWPIAVDLNSTVPIRLALPSQSDPHELQVRDLFGAASVFRVEPLHS